MTKPTKPLQEEQKQLDIPLEIVRKIERVAERKQISFNDACIFLLTEVLTPQKKFAPKGVNTSTRKPA